MTNNTNKIPKILHYCWFGGKPLPKDLKECLDTWEKLKGYKIMRWDESNCSFDENDFVRKTFKERKLGFIGDYYRLKAVYEYGGIYLDTDVKVNKSFDNLLDYSCFINFIFDDSVGTAIIGAKPGNKYIKDLLDMYDNTVFGKTPNGKQLDFVDGKYIAYGYPTSNYYHTYHILKTYKDFKLNNKFQDLGDFVIFPKEYFEIGTLTGRHYAIHLNAGEWRTKSDNEGQGLKAKIKGFLKKNPAIYDKVQILVRKKRYKELKKNIPFYSYYLAQRNNTELPDL